MSGKSQGILKWMISVNPVDYFLLIHKILLLAYEHVIDYVVGPPPCPILSRNSSCNVKMYN